MKNVLGRRHSVEGLPIEFHSVLGVSAPNLGWVPAPRYLLRRQRVLRLLEGYRPGRLLDIGCGVGALLVDLQNRGFEGHGLETSLEAMRVARAIHEPSGATLHESPETDWEGSFDYITAFEVLEHIENDVSALREWHRWLKPEGRMILSVPAHSWMWNKRDVVAGHIRRYSKRRLEAAVREAGFEIEHVEYYGFPLATALEILNAIMSAQELKKERASSNGTDKTAADRTALSGVDRSRLVRLWPIFSSAPYVLVLRFFGWFQLIPVFDRLGNGLILVARKS